MNGSDYTLHFGHCATTPAASEQPITPKTVTWSDFKALFRTPIVAPGKGGTYFTLSPMKNGQRSNENVIAGFGIILDGDKTLGSDTPGAPPPEEVHRVLSELGLEHFIYSSHSNVTKGHRWRAVIPGEWKKQEELTSMVAWTISKLHEAGVAVANVTENTTLSQPWYHARCPEEHLCDYKYLEGSGDELPDEARSFIPPPPPLSKADEDADPVLARIKERDLYISKPGVGSVWHKIVCPNRSKHTGGDDSGAAYACPSEDNAGRGGFKCHHDSCKDIHVHELRETLGFPRVQWLQRINKESFPDTSPSRGEIKVQATLENFEFMMKQYGVVIRMNEASKEREVIHPEIAGNTEVQYNRIASAMARHDIPKGDCNGFMESVAYMNSYHPVVEYLTPLEKPEGDPIRGFVENCMPEAVGDHVLPAMRMFFRQAIAAADGAIHSPNKEAIAKYEYVTVFQGSQGTNKTNLVIDMIPEALRDYVKEGFTLDLGGNNTRDVIWSATSSWLVELGELDATFKKTDIAKMKSFLSEQTDKIRKAYGRTFISTPRRTAFFATVNQLDFLHDVTGNRRFIPIEVGKIVRARDVPEVDIEACWAQAWHEYLEGEQWWPTDAEDAMFTEAANYHTSVPMVVEEFLEHWPIYLSDHEWPGEWRSARETINLMRYDTGSIRNLEVRELKRWVQKNPRGSFSHQFNLFRKHAKTDQLFIPRQVGEFTPPKPVPSHLKEVK